MIGRIDAFITVEKGNAGDASKFFVISKETMLIGRPSPDSDPDLKIQDTCVSRRHAEIKYENDRFVLRDLDSKNGTQLDGRMIDPKRVYELKDHSLVGLAIIGGEPRVLLRFRESGATRSDHQSQKNQSGHSDWLRIDEERKEIAVDGRVLSLPRKEYDLLVFLNARRGTVCSRDDIITGVWPEVVNRDGVSNETVDQLIHRLRDKVEPDPRKPKRIVSKRGFGYMLI